MTAQVYDLYINQGEEVRIPFRLKDGSGNYMNLTGYSAKAQIRNPRTKSKVGEFSCTLPLDVPGQVILTMGSSASSLIPCKSITYDIPDIFVWDLVLTDSSGSSKRLMQGKAFVSPKVSR